MDSFDHYSSVLSKFDTSSSGNESISSSVPRFGPNSLLLNGYNSAALKKILDSQATWIVGAAVYVNGFSGSANVLFGLMDAGSYQCEAQITALGKLSITRNGTVLATGATTLRALRWYYIEFKATIHNSTGAAEIKLDGASEVSVSGTDTQATGNATADQVVVGHFGGSGFNGALYIDDFYICDGTGSAPTNDYLGDIRVQALFPSGNGNTSNLVGSDGNSTDNYLLVDETPPNDDTDYVESSTVGDKDTYAFGNLTPTTGTVYGVQVVPRARKTDAGTRKIASIARLSATEVDSADKTLSTTYVYLPDVREAKPGGGTWSISDVNSAEFGAKVTA